MAISNSNGQDGSGTIELSMSRTRATSCQLGTAFNVRC